MSSARNRATAQILEVPISNKNRCAPACLSLTTEQSSFFLPASLLRPAGPPLLFWLAPYVNPDSRHEVYLQFGRIRDLLHGISFHAIFWTTSRVEHAIGWCHPAVRL